MRHLKRTAKLGRTSTHRNAMLANLVCSLIKHKRVTTTRAQETNPVLSTRTVWGPLATSKRARGVVPAILPSTSTSAPFSAVRTTR
jgi:ribosomal protein L17